MKSTAGPPAWLAITAIFAYPVLLFAGDVAFSELLPRVIAIIVAFVAAMYVYYAVASLVYRGQARLTVAVTVIATLFGLALHGFAHIGVVIVQFLAVYAGGMVIGFLTSRGGPPVRTYIVGALTVGIVITAGTWALWPDLMESSRNLSTDMLTYFKSSLNAQGTPQDQVDQFAAGFKKLSGLMVGLIPASTILTPVMQFSVGFLMFFVRTIRDNSQREAVISFTRWQVPFGIAPAVIVLAIMRLFGGDTLKLIADNGILILLIYYCVGGLSLIEYLLKKLDVSVPIRVVFYVLLVFTQLIGVLITALLGFVDSFTDWRKLAAPEIGLKKE